MRSGERGGSRKRMRSCMTLGAVLACAMMLCSCEPELSVHRLYTSDDVVFEPNLVGSWVAAEPNENSGTMQMDVVKAGADGYEFTFTTQDTPTAQVEKISFNAHLVKLHGRLFIDVVQTALQIDGKLSERQITVPGHMFGRISIDGENLQMSFLDDEWVAREIRSGDLSIDSEAEGFQPAVLTATTAELQKFVVDHADDDEAFSFAVDDLKRKSGETK
jgi:hypothetical protein